MNLAVFFLSWYFAETPFRIAKAWSNIFWFSFHYFSFAFLLKTLFSPWRGVQWSYRKGFNIQNILETFFSNLISRTLGAIIRSSLIVVSFCFTLLLIPAALLFLALWILLPLLLFFSLIYGIRILF